MDILHSGRILVDVVGRRCRRPIAGGHHERPRRRRAHLVAAVLCACLASLRRRQVAALDDGHSEPQGLQQMPYALHSLAAHPEPFGHRLVRGGDAPARELVRRSAVVVRDAQQRVGRDARTPALRLALRRAQHVHHSIEPSGRTLPGHQSPVGALRSRESPTAHPLRVRRSSRLLCRRSRRHADVGVYIGIDSRSARYHRAIPSGASEWVRQSPASVGGSLGDIDPVSVAKLHPGRNWLQPLASGGGLSR